jgi:hypothetical protein
MRARLVTLSCEPCDPCASEKVTRKDVAGQWIAGFVTLVSLVEHVVQDFVLSSPRGVGAAARACPPLAALLLFSFLRK